MPPEKPFFSQSSYIQYSVVYADFWARCLGRTVAPKKSNLAEPITFECGDNKSKKIESPRVSKANPDEKIKNEEGDKNIEKQEAGSVSLAWRYSSLTKSEHVKYMKLWEKFKENKDSKATGSVDEQQELQEFTALQRKVSLEREDFLKHLKNLALTRRRKSYFFICPDAKIFVKELLKAELNLFYQECQRHYSMTQTIQLFVPRVHPIEKDLLSFSKNILKLGQVSRFVVPQSHMCVMRTNFPMLKKKYLLEKTMGQDVHPSKQNILKDSIACNLSLKYEADIVATLKSFSTLIDNLYPNLEHSWEIPIMVITDSFGANGKIKRRVFLENPIPLTDMSVREQNTLYHEYAVKHRLALSDHCTVKRQKFAKPYDMGELQCNRELHAFDDTFGDLNEEAINLDTFGISSPFKPLNSNIIKPTLTDDAEKSSSGIQPKDLASLDYLKILSRGGKILQDSTTTYDVETPSNGDLVSQNSATTDHIEISSTGHLIPENTTTTEDVTKPSSEKKFTESPSSPMNLSDSNSDDGMIDDVELDAFLKLKEIIIEYDKIESAKEQQEMGAGESGTQQNQDSGSDDLVIDCEKEQTPVLPTRLDEKEIFIIKEVINKKMAKKREKEIKRSSNDVVDRKPTIVPKVENFHSSCGEDIALPVKSPTLSPKSEEEKRKLYKKRSTRNKSVASPVDYLIDSSDDMLLDIKCDTTKTKCRKKKHSSKSSEGASSNSSPLRLRRRTVFRYFEDDTKPLENTSLHDRNDLKPNKFNSTSSENEAPHSSFQQLRRKTVSGYIKDNVLSENSTALKQKKGNSASSENESLHSSPLQLRRRTVFRDIEDNSVFSENTSCCNSSALKQKKYNSTSSENESSQSSKSPMVLRGISKFRTIKEELPSSEYKKNALPFNSTTLNVSSDCQVLPKVKIKEEKLENTLQHNSTSLNVPNNCQEPAKIIVTKNLPEAHSSDLICLKSEIKPPLDHIMGLQQNLFKSPNSSAEKDRSASILNDSIPKQSDAVEESSKEFPQLLNGNVTYSLWRLGKLKLMLRSEVDCQIPSTSTPCFLFPKMEYQCSNGLEVTTPSELMRQWVALKTHPGSKLVRIRINTASSELKMLEEVPLSNLEREHKFHPDRAIYQTSVILNTLTDLSDGHYLLVHKAQEPTLTLLKSVQTSKYGALDFQNSLSQRISVLDDHDYDNSLKKDVPWLPIDPEIILPIQRRKQVITGCFLPKDKKGKNKQWSNNKKRSQPKNRNKIQLDTAEHPNIKTEPEIT